MWRRNTGKAVARSRNSHVLVIGVLEAPQQDCVERTHDISLPHVPLRLAGLIHKTNSVCISPSLGVSCTAH